MFSYGNITFLCKCRFIKEFNLEQEALALQYQANSVIKQVNQMIEGSPSDKIDKIGGSGADDEVVSSSTSSSEAGGGLANIVSAVPNMLGQAAVSIIR